jgi:release factor glutamine methyltransferase
MTATTLLAEARGVLAAAGVPSPDWDAERLLRHVLGLDRAALLANPGRAVPEPEAGRFRALVQRRAAREPLQYVLGSTDFWKHEFLVTPAVLIPRPETELLVETALELVKGVEKPVIVDVGTGSGCIALSIAGEREDAEVHATDVRAASGGPHEPTTAGLGPTNLLSSGPYPRAPDGARGAGAPDREQSTVRGPCRHRLARP